jgi:hypothetical protein
VLDLEPCVRELDPSEKSSAAGSRRVPPTFGRARADDRFKLAPADRA